MNRAVVSEGLHIFRNAIRVRMKGKTTYEGDALRICEQITEQCWNGNYYQTSLHNYTGFYARDFGMCVDSLLALKKRKRVLQTLEYALSRYAKVGRITQQISSTGKVFQYPNCPQPDALAFLLHAIDAVKEEKIVEKYRQLLQEEIIKLVVDVIDTQTLLVKRNIHVAGMRDHAIRDSSCYDNTMMLAIQKYATRLGLTMPLHIPKRLLVEKFWTGKYFRDDLASNTLTGDANIVPFWFDVIDSKFFTSVVAELELNKLNSPYALRYESQYNTERHMIWETILTDGWEHDTVWLHLGNLYLQVLCKHDKNRAKKELQKHTKLIERESNYPEVLTKEGLPQQSFFFAAEDSMLWACNYLAMSNSFKK